MDALRPQLEKENRSQHLLNRGQTKTYMRSLLVVTMVTTPS